MARRDTYHLSGRLRCSHERKRRARPTAVGQRICSSESRGPHLRAACTASVRPAQGTPVGRIARTGCSGPVQRRGTAVNLAVDSADRCGPRVSYMIARRDDGGQGSCSTVLEGGPDGMVCGAQDQGGGNFTLPLAWQRGDRCGYRLCCVAHPEHASKSRPSRGDHPSGPASCRCAGRR